MKAPQETDVLSEIISQSSENVFSIDVNKNQLARGILNLSLESKHVGELKLNLVFQIDLNVFISVQFSLDNIKQSIFKPSIT
jgi:hypothetical protein